jgi:cell division protein FtsB
MAACAVLDGDNDTIACIGLPGKRNEPRTTFIVFNPRCRSSPDLTGASLRIFPTPEDTVNHIASLFSIYKSADPDGPKAMYNAHVLRLVDLVTLKEKVTSSTYEVNMHLLEETRRLEVIAAREGEARREMKNLITRIEVVDDECREAYYKQNMHSEAIYRLQNDLSDVQAMTAAMLGDVQPSHHRLEAEDVEMEDLTYDRQVKLYSYAVFNQANLDTESLE